MSNVSPPGLQCDAAQAVVRIIVFRFETKNLVLLVGHAIVVGIAQQHNVVPRHQIHRAVVAHQQIHRVTETFGERAPTVEPPIAIRIGEHANAIAGWPLVSLRPLMGVRLDDEHAALAIERHTDRRNDLRVASDKLQLVAIVGNPRFGGADCSDWRIVNHAATHKSDQIDRVAMRCPIFSSPICDSTSRSQSPDNDPKANGRRNSCEQSPRPQA